jgi:hypothetical protein
LKTYFRPLKLSATLNQNGKENGRLMTAQDTPSITDGSTCPPLIK